MAVTLCLSCSPDAQPEVMAYTLLGDGFLYCILSTSSLDPNSSVPKWPLRPDVAFLSNCLELNWPELNSTGSSNSTELYNRSTPTRSIFFSLSHFVSQFPPTRFPLLSAIRMCHFLPVHHLEWYFAWAEGQNITHELLDRLDSLAVHGLTRKEKRNTEFRQAQLWLKFDQRARAVEYNDCFTS